MIRDFMRRSVSDPDVILIGEMRDPATIETALVAAETWDILFFPPFMQFGNRQH